MRRPRISLCMIVKDEAEDLPRCLESVRGVADEIIVVDTGSSDGSADIARRFGARVIRFPWRDDFAQARNAGLEEARGDWILFLDADEALDPGDREKLLQYARHTQFEGFFLRVMNYVGDGSRGTSINPVLRMFRNDKAHRFEGRIHEQIASSILRANPDAAFCVTDVKIHHYGYLSAKIAARNKVRRNLALLQKTLKETPDDPFHLYNIGIEYLRLGQKEPALEAFQKARRLASPAWSFTHLLYKCEARTLQALGRCGEAVRVCEEGIALYPGYPDLHHIKGTCEIALGRWSEARASLHAAYRIGPAGETFHTEEGMGTYQTCYALGLLHETLRDFRAAAEWYLRAMRDKPGLNPPLYRLFRFMKCRGLEKELAALILRRFRPDSPQAAEKIVTMLLATGCGRTARLVLRKWKAVISKAAYAWALSACHLLNGDGEGASRAIGRMERVLRPQSRKALRRIKAWAAWAQKAEDRRHLPEKCPPEDFPLAVKIAFAAGKPCLSMWLGRKRRLGEGTAWDVKEAERLIRAAADLADMHLERLRGPLTPAQQGLVRASRLAAPFPDGF